MNIVTDKTGTIEGFRSILEEISMDEHTRGIMILACDGNDFTPELIDDLLKKLKKPLFGGVFPAIIHNREKMEKGTIIAGLSVEPAVYTIPYLSDRQDDFDDVIETLIPDIGEGQTMFVYVDGYSRLGCC